jgi:general secretion pathway protein A
MSYLDFYSLTVDPFQSTPDTGFLFLSSSHQEALASILKGAKRRKRLIVISGQGGIGKTTLLLSYVEMAKQKGQKTIHIKNPKVIFDGLLTMMVEALGHVPASSETAKIAQVQELAFVECHRGGRLVLVVDDAQEMPARTVECLLLVLSQHTSTVVFVGHPQVERFLNLRQVVYKKILPLRRKESLAYLNHRLALVNGNPRSIFSKEALELIVNTARGIPRSLNILCENALVSGCAAKEPTISAKVVEEVITALDVPRAQPIKSGVVGHLCQGVSALARGSIYRGRELIGRLAKKFLGSHLKDNDQMQRSIKPTIAGRTAEKPMATSNPTPASTVLRSRYALKLVTTSLAFAISFVVYLGFFMTVPVVVSEQEARPNAEPNRNAPSTNDTVITDSSEDRFQERAELTETARLLAVLLDAGRVVVGRVQPTINNPRLEDKGFSSSGFESQLRKEFVTRTGHDLRNLAPAVMPERAKLLLVRLAFFMQKAVQEVQPEINKKGIGFKGFIPATFGTKVADKFSKDTGVSLRQIGPPGIESRNSANRPDSHEERALLAIQKSHPRVGDHVVEQQLPDKNIRVLLPLFYNKQCLACHGKPRGEVDISGYQKEGFKEGDLGGAISVTLAPGT